VLPLRRAPQSDLVLAGVVKAYVNEKHPRQEVEVHVSDRMVDRWVFRDGDLHHVKVRIRADLLKDFLVKPLLLITFKIKDPVSPAALGLSADKRALGLGVQELSAGNL
jgi:hypothetical protein